MNVYELEKQATPGPCHTDDGFLYSAAGDIIAQVAGDGNGYDLDMLANCRNKLIPALELLHKALPYVKFYDDQDNPAAVLASKAVCTELEEGIAKLEEVKRAIRKDTLILDGGLDTQRLTLGTKHAVSCTYRARPNGRLSLIKIKQRIGVGRVSKAGALAGSSTTPATAYGIFVARMNDSPSWRRLYESEQEYGQEDCRPDCRPQVG